jgi:hypothetical protein
VEGKFKGLSNKPLHARFWHFLQRLWRFLFFPFGHMLSATTIAAESTQNCPKLPNFVKICPKTTSLRNFEIPPKIEILAFSKKIKIYVEDAPKHVLTIWIFNTTIFCKPFLLSKNHLCMWISAYPLVENNCFSQCSTPLVGMRFCRHITNSPRIWRGTFHIYIKKWFFWPSNLCCPLRSQRK